MAKEKELDITKTGPIGYKTLQAQNNSQYDEIDDFINKSQSRILSVASQSSPYRDMRQMVQSPLANTNTTWGESIFDNKTANQADFEHLNNVRAYNQPWYAQLGAGLLKGVGLAGSTFIDGTLGLVVGTTEAISPGDISKLWDNEVSNGLHNFNQAMEEWLPNYSTEEEQNRPSYANLGPMTFWADSFLKNMGFTVGALYSGGIWTKGLKLAGKALQGAGKGMEFANAANKTTKAINRVGEATKS